MPALRWTTMPPAKSTTPHLGEKAAAPDPMDEGDVDEQAPEHEEDQVGRKLTRSANAPLIKRRGDDGEHHLEEEEGEERNRGGVGMARGKSDSC